MAIPEFVYLNEQAVRVSSWHRNTSTGAIDFVVIAKGEGDRDQLIDTFAREPVMVRIGNSPEIPMEVRTLETRSSGEGPRSVHRLHLELMPEGQVIPTPTAPDDPRVASTASIDARLDRIIELLSEIREEIRQQR